MAYELKNLQGSLFKNDRKETEKQPDYNGSCMIGGLEFWISAWIKRQEGKKTFMSLAFTEKDGAPKATTSTPAPANDSDDVPF